MLLFSRYLTDLSLARLRLHEGARYAAFELSSYPLSDYGAGEHEVAFARARDETEAEVAARFADLDSVDDVPSGTLSVAYGPLRASLENAEALSADVPLNREGAEGPALDAAQGGAKSVIGRFGLDPSGKVTARVSTTARSRLLPGLAAQSLEGRFTLIANAWNLPDGADATAELNRTGMRRSGGETGLHLQVARMKFLGARGFLGRLGDVAGLKRLIDFSLPDPDGTFVISHNYSTDPDIVRDVADRGCGETRHTAHAGLNNLAQRPGVDDRALRCFDTAPFRDTHEYADSLYKRLFDARGPHFLGCRQAMADDPAATGSLTGDRNSDPVDCE